jgi:transcriptional regulator GlxA family with amidase domain
VAKASLTTDWQELARNSQFKPSKMAATCQVSLRQLERHFAARFQMSPGAWSRNLRISLAKELLSRGLSNKEVVAELFFTDTAHLCREYKKRYGATPQHGSDYI